MRPALTIALNVPKEEYACPVAVRLILELLMQLHQDVYLWTGILMLETLFVLNALRVASPAST